jgi:uncharacterized protein (TIGR02266 family)
LSAQEKRQDADAREHARYEVNATVDVASVDLLLYHRIQNISLGGICIQTATLSEVGARVDVVLNFPDLGTQIAMQGQVVWANREPPQDVGIRWVDLDEERRRLLADYLHRVRDREAAEAPSAQP